MNAIHTKEIENYRIKEKLGRNKEENI